MSPATQRAIAMRQAGSFKAATGNPKLKALADMTVSQIGTAPTLIRP